jgi:hypothetical protein
MNQIANRTAPPLPSALGLHDCLLFMRCIRADCMTWCRMMICNMNGMEVMQLCKNRQSEHEQEWNHA